MTHKVTLDTCYPDDDIFQTSLTKLGIHHEVVNEFGPAGGNPEVEYTGTKEALIEMIYKHFDDNSGDLSFYTDMIKEA